MNYQQLRGHPDLNRFVAEKVMGWIKSGDYWMGPPDEENESEVVSELPDYLDPEGAEEVRKKIEAMPYYSDGRVQCRKHLLRIRGLLDKSEEAMKADDFSIEPWMFVLAAALAMGFEGGGQ